MTCKHPIFTLNNMKPLLLLFSTIVIYGCSKQVVNHNPQWDNPPIVCNIPDNAEEVVIEFGDCEIQGKAGLEDFCERMQKKFADSNLTPNEASALYSILVESGLNLNESFGEPSPNIVSKPKVGMSQRVSLRKVDETTFEIFYIKVGCGKSYFYGKFIKPMASQALNLQPIEVWVAPFPC